MCIYAGDENNNNKYGTKKDWECMRDKFKGLIWASAK